MNKTRTVSILLITMLALIFAIILPAGAEEIKRLYFEDVGVSLEMPDSVQYITMDMIKNHSFPNNSGISYEEYRDYFEKGDIYVLCYKKNEDGNILVQIQESPSGYEKVSIDRSSEDARLKKIVVKKLFEKMLKNAGYIIWDSDEYEGENYTGFRFHDEWYDGSSTYSTSYIFMEDGRLIRLTANTPDESEEKFPEDREQILREIFDSIQVHPLPEKDDRPVQDVLDSARSESIPEPASGNGGEEIRTGRTEEPAQDEPSGGNEEELLPNDSGNGEKGSHVSFEIEEAGQVKMVIPDSVLFITMDTPENDEAYRVLYKRDRIPAKTVRLIKLEGPHNVLYGFRPSEKNSEFTVSVTTGVRDNFTDMTEERRQHFIDLYTEIFGNAKQGEKIDSCSVWNGEKYDCICIKYTKNEGDPEKYRNCIRYILYENEFHIEVVWSDSGDGEKYAEKNDLILQQILNSITFTPPFLLSEDSDDEEADRYIRIGEDDPGYFYMKIPACAAFITKDTPNSDKAYAYIYARDGMLCEDARFNKLADNAVYGFRKSEENGEFGVYYTRGITEDFSDMKETRKQTIMKVLAEHFGNPDRGRKTDSYEIFHGENFDGICVRYTEKEEDPEQCRNIIRYVIYEQGLHIEIFWRDAGKDEKYRKENEQFLQELFNSITFTPPTQI